MNKYLTILLIPLSVALTDCTKDNPIEEETKETPQLIEIEFNKTIPDTKTITLNGTEVSTLSFNAEKGDKIEIDANNDCGFDIVNNVKLCSEYKVSIYSDGILKANESCECDLLELNYTVE